MMQPPNEYEDAMMADDDGFESTQQTQSTQPLSQNPQGIDSHIWGFLQPCSPALKRIDFWKSVSVYDIGRNPDGNVIILPGFKVSNKHAKISWDGQSNKDSAVVVQDLSSNGTFINGQKVGKGQSRIVRDGNELAFGTPLPQHQNNGQEDYRFVFRLVAAGPATEGIHAHYDLGVELGKGSFASVYKAMHRQTGKWYAVKIIQADKIKKNTQNQTPGADPRKATAFAREISILEQLQHPNICQLKEAFMDDSDPNINLVLELIEGGDLLDYILSREGISKGITFQICDALAYIHAKGIAHRDLKPENVLLTKDDPPIVKVADFGLAKVVDSLTALRTMCGTPSYLAPEVVNQIQNEGYSHLVDSWSVGVIVFSMLTNTSPFLEDDNIPDLRTRISERTVDWDALDRAGISEEGKSFITRLLDPRPDCRMSLDAARSHVWLASVARQYGYQAELTPSTQPSIQPSIQSSTPSDQPMASGISGEDSYVVPGLDGESFSQGLEQMQLHGAESTAGNTLRREGSRPLVRRSDVLSQAAEKDDGGGILEPSEEMISNSQAQDLFDERNAAPGPSTRKRKEPPAESLMAVPEDEEFQADTSNGHKKGKVADDFEGTARSVRGTRAKGAGGVSSDEEPSQKVRRSARQTPQKAPRK
ncbi:hypothetical protein HWV62_40589 [Athelia sp. TMB]|nr:hypothetical protein HWV62_40589 [Athelia sp. TMB]